MIGIVVNPADPLAILASAMGGLLPVIRHCEDVPMKKLKQTEPPIIIDGFLYEHIGKARKPMKQRKAIERTSAAVLAAEIQLYATRGIVPDRGVLLAWAEEVKTMKQKPVIIIIGGSVDILRDR